MVGPTCCVPWMPIAESMTTAGVSGYMIDIIASSCLSSSGMFDLSVGSLEVS